MSHSIGEPKDDGWFYTVTVNGLTMSGWRCGTRAQVEEYARLSERMCANRAIGAGFSRIDKNGNISTSHLRGGRKSARLQAGARNGVKVAGK